MSRRSGPRFRDRLFAAVGAKRAAGVSRRFVRQLVVGMTAAALIVSALIGGGVWYFQMENVDEAVAALAEDEARILARWNDGDLEDPVVAGARLQSLMSARRAGDAGHFVFAKIYASDHRPIAAASLDADEGIETAFDRVTHAFPVDGKTHYDKMILNGRLYLRVIAPRGAGGFNGYFDGIFAVAPKRLARINDAALTAALSVVAVVAATALFLLPVVIRLNRDLVRLSENLARANVEILEVLGVAVAKRDSDTGQHNYRVTLYAVRLAEALGIRSDEIRALIKGAFLHDVGKIGISDTILLKPGKLTTEEFEVMKGHVQLGMDIVARSSWLKDARDVIVFHHERFDGSGYMHGLNGEAIPLAARLFAIVDVFDALTSRRPYKEPLPVEQSMRILDENRGSHFDPRLLDVFSGFAIALHAELDGLSEQKIRQRLHDLVTKYFFEGRDYWEKSGCPAWLAEQCGKKDA